MNTDEHRLSGRVGSALVVALLSCSCGSVPQPKETVSKSMILEHGYRVERRTENVGATPGSFEKVAHYRDLYFETNRLGTGGQYAISPSGRFALFEDKGRLLLFVRETGTTRDVTDGTFAIPKSVVWNERGNSVEVVYYSDHEPIVIGLPE